MGHFSLGEEKSGAKIVAEKMMLETITFTTGYSKHLANALPSVTLRHTTLDIDLSVNSSLPSVFYRAGCRVSINTRQK